MNNFQLLPNTFKVTFGKWVKSQQGYEVADEQTMYVKDCYFDCQAEQQFWKSVDFNYDAYVVIEVEELEWSIMDNIMHMEKSALEEHLFGTTEFGLTDQAKVKLYYQEI